MKEQFNQSKTLDITLLEFVGKSVALLAPPVGVYYLAEFSEPIFLVYWLLILITSLGVLLNRSVSHRIKGVAWCALFSCISLVVFVIAAAWMFSLTPFGLA